MNGNQSLLTLEAHFSEGMRAGIHRSIVLGQAIKHAGPIGYGELFAAVGDQMTLSEFEKAVGRLKSLSLVEETESGVLKWLGQ